MLVVVVVVVVVIVGMKAWGCRWCELCVPGDRLPAASWKRRPQLEQRWSARYVVWYGRLGPGWWWWWR